MWKETLAAKKAILHIAEREGISIEDVSKEIELAIAEAINNSDEAALERWSRIPCTGERPTAVEFIAYMSKALRNHT